MEEWNKTKNKAKIPYVRNSSKIKNQNRKKKPNRYPLYTNKSKNKQTRKADKMKITKCNNVETVPESNTKIVERGTIDTPNTQIVDHSLSWFGTGTSIKSGGVKLVKDANQ